MATEAANAVVGKVIDLLFGAIKREIDYVRKYAENIDKLRNETKKLRDMRGRVQQRIRMAQDNGEDLLHGVEEWVDEANSEVSKVETLLEEADKASKTFFNLRACVNLGTLYRYSKMATKKASSISAHYENGWRNYETCVSLPATTPGLLDLYPKKNLDEIDTQQLTLKKIMEAIKDESIQIVGIYGAGGVGKTTLAKEAAAIVKNLFADVVFTTVSQNVNVEKIKADVKVAARRIMKREKILIILDDIWRKLKLDELGIPCGIDHLNCKILLTSRRRDVCMAMGAQSKICVEPLPKKEAWILFKRMAGERVETDPELMPVAREVADECGGLPLIIQVVGKALEGKPNDLWKSALDQLKNHAPMDIDPEIRRAFIHLELSYDFLENEVAQSCFLLCSMFPEDSLIPLESLTYYMVGLGKFEHLRSLDDARGRVIIAISALKSSFLLLEGTVETTTKMHDVVRDVALLIASKGQNNFLVEAGTGLKEWRIDRNALNTCTTLSLMDNDIHKVPDEELDCPHLDTLLLQGNRSLSTISDAFIQGVKKVKVFDIAHTSISSLPKSFASLTKLGMLNLGGNTNLKDIHVLAELKCLEILILAYTGIEEIPQQFGELSYLRLLDVRYCRHLSHVPPGVISKLHGLEELYIEYKSTQEGRYNSLAELSNLNRLTFLHISVPSDDLIPEDVHFFETLKGFFIEIQVMEDNQRFEVLILDIFYNPIHRSMPSRRTLVLRNCYLKIPLLRKLEKLMEVTQYLSLGRVYNLNDIVPGLNKGGFNNLKSIEIDQCNNVSCLVDPSDWDQRQVFCSLERLKISCSDKLHEIWHSHLPRKSFIKLDDINISHCQELQVIVPPNMPHVVHNIRTLSVGSCRSVRCIFDCEGLGEMRLSKLENLHLFNLPKLEVIWSCPDQSISLTSLVICTVTTSKLRRLFSANVAQGLVHLQELKIFACDCLEEVIWAHDEKKARGEIEVVVPNVNIVFPCLRNIILDSLTNLKSFCSGDHTIEYPSLVQVTINRCISMEIWGYRVQHMPKLEHVSTSMFNPVLIPVQGHDGINDVVRGLFRH